MIGDTRNLLADLAGEVNRQIFESGLSETALTAIDNRIHPNEVNAGYAVRLAHLLIECSSTPFLDENVLNDNAKHIKQLIAKLENSLNNFYAEV